MPKKTSRKARKKAGVAKRHYAQAKARGYRVVRGRKIAKRPTKKQRSKR